MKTLIAAIHGIMTSQTDPSWPDKFDAWMLQRDPEVKVLKKEYCAGPFPRWNCWIKDPALARGLANEIELFFNGAETLNLEPRTLNLEQNKPLTPTLSPSDGARENLAGYQPSTLNTQRLSVWFVAHSNGAVIALLTAKILIARGYKIGGLILTGAAVEADVQRNGVMDWWSSGVLGAAIAYSSPEDEVLDGDPAHPSPIAPRPSPFALIREWFWSKLMWPYGCLGRTGWLIRSPKTGEFSQSLVTSSPTIFTRWFAGGHSMYFAPANIEGTFEQIYEDVKNVELLKSGNGSMTAEDGSDANKNPKGIPTQSPGLRGTSYPGCAIGR